MTAKVVLATLPGASQTSLGWKPKSSLQCVSLTLLTPELLVDPKTYLVVSRWCPFLCNYIPRAEGSPHGRLQEAASRCLCLGGGGLTNVQFLAQRIQDEEWWLSILSTSLLTAVSMDRSDLQHPTLNISIPSHRVRTLIAVSKSPVLASTFTYVESE